ncbi:hypothetical protein GGD81_004337 [Rhodobium orientis]|uniref:hypothetical protein n=1 Tax=Rhodobium orientis TaxID=34017 RepID=UPI0011B93CE8|nr:hypothetical protein [Rhodobium orientis]MBB4305263.1 hypothetical protein [Rhodobium orientis]
MAEMDFNLWDLFVLRKSILTSSDTIWLLLKQRSIDSKRCGKDLHKKRAVMRFQPNAFRSEKRGVYCRKAVDPAIWRDRMSKGAEGGQLSRPRVAVLAYGPAP